MKKLFICIMMMLSLSVNNSSAQNVERKGNTFKTVKKSRSTTKDTLLTNFYYEDSQGISYPIIVRKKSGRCYVWKKNNTTGRLYPMNLKEDISKAVCKELGITYVERKRK